MTRRVTDYPSKPCIKHVVTAARDAGLRVTAIVVKPDGTVILSEAPLEAAATSEVDRWFAENGLETL